MKRLPNDFRGAIDVKLGEMLACPTGGHEHVHVSNVAILDAELISTALVASVETGRSWVFVHIPVEWDASQPVIADAISATDMGVRVQRNLVLWTPQGTGPTLLLCRETGSAFKVTPDGLAETTFNMSPEIRPGFGVARAVRTLITAAIEADPTTALAA